MSYDKITQASEVLIGAKQTMKALEAGEIKEIFLAEDADAELIYSVVAAAKLQQVPVFKVGSMKKLGKACGINVGAAAAALKK